MCMLVWVPEPTFLFLPHRWTLRYGSPLPLLGFSSLCCCSLRKYCAPANTSGLDMSLADDKSAAAASHLFKMKDRAKGDNLRGSLVFYILCQHPNPQQIECMLCKCSFKAHPLALLKTKLPPILRRHSVSTLVTGGLKYE